MLCYLSGFLKTIGFPLVMGFVRIFVPGTKYITCDELEEHIEDTKEAYDENKEGKLNTEDVRKMLKQKKFLLLDARRRDEFCVSHILLPLIVFP